MKGKRTRTYVCVTFENVSDDCNEGNGLKPRSRKVNMIEV